MSPATQSYFLPKVFPSELFTLGQFVSNPLTPTIFPFTGVQTGEIAEAEPEIPFETVACVDKRGWLGLKVPRLIEIGGGGDSGRLLCIKAEEMRYRTLKDPDTVFKKTLEHSEEARKWMSEMKLNGQRAHMVIGLSELKNAQFFKAKLTKGDGGAYVTIPVDNIPVQLGGRFSQNAAALANSTVNGVFGIEVREIALETGNKGDAKLSNKLSWKFSYERVKGEQDEEDLRLYAELANAPSTEILEEFHAHLESEDEGDEG
jgi:hypothetical protein